MTTTTDGETTGPRRSVLRARRRLIMDALPSQHEPPSGVICVPRRTTKQAIVEFAYTLHELRLRLVPDAVPTHAMRGIRTAYTLMRGP